MNSRIISSRSSRAVVAYSGLVAILGLACTFSAFVPTAVVPAVLGALVVTAAGLGLLIELVSDSPSTRSLRTTWSSGALLVGAALLASPLLPDLWPRFLLAAFLGLQGILLFAFAQRAWRTHELGSPPLIAEGVTSLGLAILVLFAYPLAPAWVVGGIVAVGLLDYAATLGFLEIEGGARRFESP